MLIQFYYPEKLSPSDLDYYLSRGWFRNSVMLHNSKVICLDQKISSILNIRLDLEDYQPGKSLRKLLKKNKSRFRFEIGAVRLTKQKEDLYAQHLHKFKGFLFSSLDQFLFANISNSVFDTSELCLYDGDKLIGYSLFDLGKDSMASLLAVYDNEYASFSPGIYTMLLEVEYALSLRLKHYYPGYVLNNSSDFDYKLRLGGMKYLNSKGHWVNFKELTKVDFPSELIEDKSNEISKLLHQNNIDHSKKYNPYYTIGYVKPYEKTFSRSTVVLILDQQPNKSSYYQLEYLYEEDLYQMSIVTEDPNYDNMVDMIITEDLKDRKVYQTTLLPYRRTVTSTKDIDLLIESAKSELLHLQ